MINKPLKLAALDSDDLAILSAHFQDPVVKVGDMALHLKQNLFVAVVNRFDWEHGLGACKGPYRRRRTGLHFKNVQSAQTKLIQAHANDVVFSLLAIKFKPDEAPGGIIVLQFPGNGAVRLRLECIEAQISDLGPSWGTENRPQHEGGIP